MALWQRYNIEVVVVLEGLRPACLNESNQDHEIMALKKSHKIWTKIMKCKENEENIQATNDIIFKQILQEYGSRFYMQEVINATKEVPNCTFFVAPYLQTPQIAQFYADNLIQVAFGTSRLLIHNEFD